MAIPGLLEEVGSRPAKQLRYAPIFTNRFFTGLWTQRNPLRDPSDRMSEKFYGGRPDALISGSNVELNNRLTLTRRPGLVEFSTAALPQAPDYFYSFHQFLTNGSTSIKLMADTASAIYYQTPSASTSIFTKSAGAGQSFFQGVGAFLYFSDGVDQQKWDGETVWNWGIAAPLSAPAVTITPSGSAAVPWTASTFYSTMGLLVDSNNNIQQLTSVNATGLNTTQYGTTGDGQPNWNNTTGDTTTDNTVTWTCAGPLSLWAANKAYPANACIFVPGVGGTPIPGNATSGVRNLTYTGKTGGGIFCALSGGTSGSAQPKWNPTTDQGSADAFGHWNFLGAAVQWLPSTRYNSFWEWSNQVVCEPTLPTAAILTNNTQTIYAQTANNASTGSTNTPGISGTGYTPPWATVVGQTTVDNDLIWVDLGSKTWQADTTYTAWTAGAATFSALVDGNGNFEVCIQSGTSQGSTPLNTWQPSHVYALNALIAVQSPTGYVEFKVTSNGTSGASEPTSWNFTTGSTTTDNTVTWTSQGPTTIPVWGATYGSQMKDGGAIWVNVGTAANSTWATGISWYLPASGFYAPTTSDPYGGPQVIANSDVQAIIGSGLSGTMAPSWGAIGTNTTDNDATWYTVAAASTNSLSWTSGHNYAYSYKARAANDVYVTTIPPGLTSPLGPPTGPASGGVSTASPIYTMAVGPNSGSVNTISGIGSTDPQVDTISIFRTLDGGSTLFWLTDIQNPPPINGNAQPWSFQDFLPDNATSVYPGLNILVQAPIDHANDPPPAGLVNSTYHFGRVWGSVGGTVYASGGPDTDPGNGAEAFPPLNFWTFPDTVTSLVPTSTGLIVFTVSDIYIIAGGPATATFYSNILLPGYGLVSWNALDVNGGVIYFFSSARQFIALDPSSGTSEVGMPIGDQLLFVNPATAYVTFHIGGSTDTAVYLADGSTGWYRCNPNQAPEGGAVWSPKASISGGCKAVQSIEVSAGVRKLLVGTSNPSGGLILNRDLNTFSDNGLPYPANFVMGSLVLAEPGQLAELSFTTADFVATGSQPTVSYLLDEIGAPGTFVPFVGYVPDPPQLSASKSLYANRYYFSQSATPAWCRHMQVRVDYGATDVVQNEILTLTIFGSHWQER